MQKLIHSNYNINDLSLNAIGIYFVLFHNPKFNEEFRETNCIMSSELLKCINDTESNIQLGLEELKVKGFINYD